MNSNIFIKTFGCRLNRSETAALNNAFLAAGFGVVQDMDQAQIVVINTCTVTQHGDADTAKLIRRIHRNHPQARIALVGCQSQLQQERLAQYPNVRWVVGNARKMDLARILKEGQGEPGRPLVLIPELQRENFTVDFPAIDRTRTRANLKIQDGCDFFCSYCTIPLARGRARSRRYEDIIKEARALIAAGHQELVLTGVNIGVYRDEGRSLLDVIDALSACDGLVRLRLSSVEPLLFGKEILSRMFPRGPLCRFLHVPLQSGCNRVLKAMNRKYTFEQFAHWMHALRESCPEVCLGTDVIVGFPGETEQEFEQTYAALQQLPVAYCHVFSYSRRDGTPSSQWEGQVRDEDKRIRSARLRELSHRKRERFYAGLIGQEEDVLFEQCRSGVWSGLTDRYVRVFVRSHKDLRNQVCRVTMTEVREGKVWGNVKELRESV